MISAHGFTCTRCITSFKIDGACPELTSFTLAGITSHDTVSLPNEKLAYFNAMYTLENLMMIGLSWINSLSVVGQNIADYDKVLLYHSLIIIMTPPVRSFPIIPHQLHLTEQHKTS